MDQNTREIIQCLGVLQDGVAGIREENKGIRLELHGIREENKGIRKENEGIRFELQDIRKENNGIRVELQDIRKENNGIRLELQDIRKENDGIRIELQDIRKENDGIRVELQGIRKESNGIRVELQDIREENNGIRVELQDIRAENDVRDRDTKREFQKVREEMGAQFQKVYAVITAIEENTDRRFAVLEDILARHFEDVDSRFEDVNFRFDGVSHALETFEVLFANSRIFNLNQPIRPLICDSAPVPTCFPSRALELYDLQKQKNWASLKKLILYYNLEDEASRLVFDDADSTENRDDKVEKALESSPFVVMSVLGYHLGVDCDALHDRVQQFKFLKGMNTKRSAKSNDDGKKIIKRPAIQGKGLSLPGVEIGHASESRFADDEKSEERQTEAHSKVNSSRKTSVSKPTRASPLHPSKAYASRSSRSEASSGGQRIVPSMDSRLDVPTPGALRSITPMGRGSTTSVGERTGPVLEDCESNLLDAPTPGVYNYSESSTEKVTSSSDEQSN